MSSVTSTLGTGQIIKSPFKPPWWLKGSHGQTLWPNIVKKRNLLALRRERIELSDQAGVLIVLGMLLDQPLEVGLSRFLGDGRIDGGNLVRVRDTQGAEGCRCWRSLSPRTFC